MIVISDKLVTPPLNPDEYASMELKFCLKCGHVLWANTLHTEDCAVGTGKLAEEKWTETRKVYSSLGTCATNRDVLMADLDRMNRNGVIARLLEDTEDNRIAIERV